jgi:dTDP-4-amino-4,6-dideoxygalactose transaminase
MYSRIQQAIQYHSGKKYSYLVGNGTSAIYLALKVSKIPIGAKIALPNIACPDPAYAIIWAGYIPIFVDVNIDDYNMDTSKLEYVLKRDKDIKGIIAIHLFGNACDIVQIQELAQLHNCFLIEDSAQSFGNSIAEGKLGSFGDVSIFSFGKGKILEVGHGGSIQSNSKKIIDDVKLEYDKLACYNEKKITKISKWHRSIYYKLYSLGLKYRMLNVLNLVYVYFFKSYYLYQFDAKKLHEIFEALTDFENNKKKRIAKVSRYKKLLGDKVILPVLHNRENILSRLTIVVVEAEMLAKEIRDKGIPSNTMYPMLVDRFELFFNRSDYENSYYLKGKLLNLWTSDVGDSDLKTTARIIKETSA